MNGKRIDRISIPISKIGDFLAYLGTSMADRADKSDIDRALQTLDHLVDHHRVDLVERATQSTQLSRYEEAIDKHEERLTKLEHSSV